jgi:hypothetical protein
MEPPSEFHLGISTVSLISEQSEQQLGRGCTKKLLFDLCVAVIAIAELIFCTASELPWQFV